VKFLGFRWIGRRQVTGLADVVGEVVEFDAAVLEVFDQFPVADADCAAGGGSADVAGQVPEDGVSNDDSGVL